MATLSDLALRILISAKDETGPSVKSATQGIRSISDQLQQVETLARRFLDVRLFAGWAQEGIKLSDTYAGLSGRLRQVVGESGNLAQTQQKLFQIAQDTQTPLAETVGLYARSNEALKKYTGGQELAAKLSETVGLSFKAQAIGAADASSTITQLTQAISTDAVQWEDFGQLADTNLMLVNVAAKNLGYDGLGSLKKAMEAGKVSNIDLVNAIVKGQDEIRASADKMPVTVGAAWTMVNNALLKYVGESDKAKASTTLLSGLLQGLANNIGLVADGATVLATLLLGRMAQGWLQSAQAARQSAQAAAEKAAADALAQQAAQKALVVETQVAAARVKALAVTVEESRLYAAIVAGTEKETAAKKALTVAITQLHAAQTKQQALNTGLTSGLESATQKTGFLATATRLLGTAFNGLFAAWVAWDIGKSIGEWLMQFERVRLAGSYLAEMLVKIKANAEGMLNGTSFSERAAEFKRIHADFEQMRAAETAQAKDSSSTIQQSEADKAKATEQAAQLQQQAFAKVQEATKALTAQIDADAKTQTTAIQQALQERLIAIENSDAGEIAKDNQRVQAKMQAAQQELQLQQQTSQLKLQLIDQEFKSELAQVANNAQRLNEVENTKKQAKLSVYQGLAEYFQGEISKLSELYAQETQAANKSNDTLKQMALTHTQEMIDIDRMGMDSRQKIRSEQTEFDANQRQIQAELAKGAEADQNKINDLLTRNKEISKDIFTQENQNADSEGKRLVARENYKTRENAIYASRKQSVEQEAQAHITAAQIILDTQGNIQTSLGATNTIIKTITAQLNKEYLLKMGVDQTSLSAAQTIIADLIKPATKIITIKTVGGGDAAGAATGAPAPAPAQATGGLAGIPSGTPWKFAEGGWARMQGLLAGYGGGDRRKALLEDGEFIIRKEAVKKLGVPFMQLVNSGQVPMDGVIKRSSGGLADDEIEKAFQTKGVEALKKYIEGHKDDNTNDAMELANPLIRERSIMEIQNRLSNNLSDIEQIGANFDLPAEIIDQAKKAMENIPKAYNSNVSRLATLIDITRINQGFEDPSKLRHQAFKDDNAVQTGFSVDYDNIKKGHKEVVAFNYLLDNIGKLADKKVESVAPAVVPAMTDIKPIKLPEIKPLSLPKLTLPKIPEIKPPSFTVPTPAIPSMSMAAAPAAPSGVDLRTALQDIRGGGSSDRVVTVQFKPANGGSPVSGQFNAGDVDMLLNTLKDAAGRGLVGSL